MRFSVTAIAVTLSLLTMSASNTTGDEVIAFWGFESDYDFSASPSTKLNFAADVDNTVSGDASLQAFRGDSDDIDQDGGGGFRSYTSPVSGTIYAPTRTVKWDDLAGGGGDFDIGGVDTFNVDKLDGAGALSDDFGNDALLYLMFDTTNFQNIRLRFDVEATPTNNNGASILPESFDVFYRVGGSGTWFREPSQNNLALSFSDLDPNNVDLENQVADTGFISLTSALNDQSMVELIINDFNEDGDINPSTGGNGEMEIDNIEIIGTAVPEPGTFAIGLIASAGIAYRRRRRVTAA